MNSTDTANARGISLSNRRNWVAACVLIGFCAALIAQGQTVAPAPEAIVKRVSGTVTVLGNDSTPKPAKEGARLAAGDTLRTDKDGTAELELVGTGGVRVDFDTEAKLPSADVSLQLLKGRLFLNIDAAALKKKGQGEFRLKTPATILAVKGTRFFVAISADGETVGVHQGNVAVTEPTSGQTLAVKSGSAVDVRARKVSAARTLKPSESALGILYSGRSKTSWVFPIGNGDRWLTVGSVFKPDGKEFYINSAPWIYGGTLTKDGRLLGAEHGKQLTFDNTMPLANLAIDRDGNLFVSRAKEAFGEIYRIPADGSDRTKIWTSGMSGGLKGKITGVFAFGATAEGAIDVDTLYLETGKLSIGASSSRGLGTLWQLKRVNGAWGQAVKIADLSDHVLCPTFHSPSQPDFIPSQLLSMVIAGPNEAYLCMEGSDGKGGPRCMKIYFVQDWKNGISFSQVLPAPPQSPPSTSAVRAAPEPYSPPSLSVGGVPRSK